MSWRLHDLRLRKATSTHLSVVRHFLFSLYFPLSSPALSLISLSFREQPRLATTGP